MDREGHQDKGQQVTGALGKVMGAERKPRAGAVSDISIAVQTGWTRGLVGSWPYPLILQLALLHFPELL